MCQGAMLAKARVTNLTNNCGISQTEKARDNRLMQGENKMVNKAGESAECVELPNYKIKAFKLEDQESFAPYYRMSDALLVAVRMANLAPEIGIDAELLKNLVQSTRDLTPAGPYNARITGAYVRSVTNICDEAEILAAHFRIDRARVPPTMDKWSEDALVKTTRLCEDNNAMLRDHFFQHEKPYEKLQERLKISNRNG